MRQYLRPGDAGRDIQKLGLEKTAKQYGLTLAELNDFIEKHGLASWEMVDLTRMYGKKGTRTPEYLQEALDRHGRKGAAEHLGINLGTLNNYISRYGLKAPKSTPTVPSREELAPLLEKYTLSEVANIYSVTEKTVSRWVGQHGLKSRRTMELEAKNRYDFRSMLRTRSAAQISEETGVPIDIILR